MIDVYFNRPDRALDIGDMIEDIQQAQRCVVLASAWFTDVSVAQTIIDCPAACKLVFLNNGDRTRGDRLAVQRLYQGLRADQIIVLGGESFEEGIMHHKWCLIDERIVWVGSYNFTMAARRNFETLMRINDPEVASCFWEETKVLLTYEGETKWDIDVPSVCIRCGQLVDHEFQVFEYDGIVCTTCESEFYETH